MAVGEGSQGVRESGSLGLKELEESGSQGVRERDRREVGDFQPWTPGQIATGPFFPAGIPVSLTP